MPIERTPRNPLPVDYVPPGGFSYRVKDGDDWRSVALKHGVDVNALVYFNFKTNNPDEVNWYLRRNVGCKKATNDNNNWRFSSDAQPGNIYLPLTNPPSFTFTRSIASLSWIDPQTGLPAVDMRGNPGERIQRSAILAKQGYRFANFLEASISVIGPMLSVVGDFGFTKESGMYRSLSYGNIPSEPFSIKRTTTYIDDGVRFKQTVGARTQSPEILAERMGGPFGSVISRGIAEEAFALPPIWTELELTIYYDGRYAGKLLRHSLFPSISFYYGSKIMKLLGAEVVSSPGPGGLPLGVIVDLEDTGKFYYKMSDYDAVLKLKNWKDRGWGPLRDAYPSGPVGGNPWDIPSPRGFGSGRYIPTDLGIPIESPIDTAGDYVEEIDSKEEIDHD
jgi:hypothetical protein